MTALETKLLARDRSGILRSFALYGTATIDILLVYVVSVCMIPPISSPISLSQNLPLDQLSSHSIFAPVVSESRINICIYKKKKKKNTRSSCITPRMSDFVCFLSSCVFTLCSGSYSTHSLSLSFWFALFLTLSLSLLFISFSLACLASVIIQVKNEGIKR